MRKRALSADYSWVAAALFGLFWCGITFTIDGVIIWQIIRQLETCSFAETSGTVISSQVKLERDGEGTSYRPEIHFRYTVNGKEYEGTEFRRDFVGMGEGLAKDVVQRYPLNQAVTVRYNTAAPEQAVLEHFWPDSSNLLVAMFLSPFNAVGCGCILLAVTGFRRWVLRRPVLGVSLKDDGQELVLTVYSVSPVLISLIVWGAAGFLCMVASLVLTIFLPYTLVMVAGWIAILGVVIAATIYAYQLRTVLRMDRFHGRLTVLAPGRPEEIVAAENLRPATCDCRTEKGADGENKVYYAVEFVYWHKESQNEVRLLLESESSEYEAQQYVEWLNGLFLANKAIGLAE